MTRSQTDTTQEAAKGFAQHDHAHCVSDGVAAVVSDEHAGRGRAVSRHGEGARGALRRGTGAGEP